MLEPTNIDEVQQSVGDCKMVIPTGGNTKPALRAVVDNYERISMLHLSGIVEYDPGEFTITVLAGTTLSELQEVLRDQGQYLPFDPPLASAGATIGGTVAAGLSGPGAYRFGPIRDFLIGVRYIDGEGKVITAGGKVVKNSAGFDIPKFLIGSIGRLGVLVELTFKVFPEPEARSTFSFPVNDPEQAAELMARFNRSFFDLEALDYLPDTNLLWGRLAGNAKAMNARLQRIGKLTDGITVHERDRSNDFWQEQLDFSWIDPDLPLAKFAITASSIKRHNSNLKNFRFSLGGNTAWVNAPVEDIFFATPGMLIRNPDSDGSIWTEQPKPFFKIQTALKEALDFPGKFPPFF